MSTCRRSINYAHLPACFESINKNSILAPTPGDSARKSKRSANSSNQKSKNEETYKNTINFRLNNDFKNTEPVNDEHIPYIINATW